MNLWILAVSAALVVQVSALVPTCQSPDPHGYCISQGVDNCAPENRRITSLTDQCRTSSRFSPDHVLPPEWELMFDSYDYESLVGSVFLNREFDNDEAIPPVADQWEDRGGICGRGLRVCAHTLGAQDNWVFSPHIKYPPGSTTLGGGLPTEIYFNVSFRFTQCNSPCVNNFADLYRYDTNSIASESVRTDRNNYLTSLFGTGTNMTTSQLDQTGRSGTVSETKTLAITSSRTNGFYFGIRDSGNCGQINRIYFYYTPCKERQDELVNYPELVRPPNGSPPNEGMACCAPNSHPTTSLTFRAHSATDGRCEHNVVKCECDAGYRLNEDGTGCVVCPAGTYRSLTDDQGACLDCPMNTVMDVEGAAICSCLFRVGQGSKGDCTAPPGPIRNLRTTTITSTSVSLSWTRPEVTGRDDFYYSIEYSDPNNGSFILSNGNYVNSALTVSYTVPNLRPNTSYTIRVTTHNEVSNQDIENEALRRVYLPTKTLGIVPSVPQDVQVFSGVIVWGPPAEPNGVITGYQLRFSGSFTRTVNKLLCEKYHVVTDDNIRSLGSNIQVSVRARTSAHYGLYSTAIPYTVPSTACPTPTTSPPEQDDVYFSLRGRSYTDGDTVLITDIGEGDDGLLCVTDNTECCRLPADGELFYPDGTAVSFTSPVLLNRGEQFIRLNRRNGATSPLGRYRCDIPDASGITRSIFINIGVGECPTSPPVMLCPTCPPVECTECPPTSTPRDYPTVTCPTTPTPRDCPTVTCPPTPTPRDCPAVTCPTTPTPRDCPTVTCPTTPTPRDCPTVTPSFNSTAPQCLTLLPPLNGRVSASGGIATYTCSTGYYLIGFSRRTCLSNGQWSGNAPTCQLAQILCPVLPNPTNGDVSTSSRSSGGIATYSCNAGYALSGLQRRICESNGVWSGSQPTCAIGFMLRGETFANGSSVFLEDIGETDEALIFRTKVKDCCRVQKIGQCYDPNGVQLSTRAFNNELYRNRDSQLVRLNKNKIFTGQAAIPGLYCCTVPNNDGNLHRICANIIA